MRRESSHYLKHLEEFVASAGWKVETDGNGLVLYSALKKDVAGRWPPLPGGVI